MNICKKILCASFTAGLLQTSVLPGTDASAVDSLHVRTESYRSNGVLGCGPSKDDTTILHTLIFNNIHSLNDYACWVKKNVSYQRHGLIDEWTPAQATLTRRHGDCKDLALLNSSVLQVLGYKAVLLAIYGPGFGHALCAFEQNGSYMLFDNNELKKTRASTMVELTSYIADRYNCNSIAIVTPEDKKLEILYQKTDLAQAGTPQTTKLTSARLILKTPK